MSKAKDDNDRLRAGETLDPREGMEEVKEPLPDEDELEHLAPLGSSLYGLSALERDRRRELLSLATLPNHFGLGEPLDSLIGGGLCPGDLVAIGAASAGAGKTAFVMQLANGLALQTAKITLTDNQAPLTPVMVLSELSPDSLARRSLAWITEERAATFRAGKTAEHLKGPHIVEDAYQKARSALSEHGVFSQIQQWQRQIKTSALFQQIRQEGDPSGTALIRKVRTLVTAWKTQLQKIFSTREIWPVVFIDPIQRWQEYEKSEVEGLNELVEAIDIAADEEGWIVLVTSDTNKQSAKGEYKQNTESDPMEIGASLFRGSYKLLHCADLACFLDKAEGDPNDVTKYIPLQIFKNRFGPTYGRVHYAWHTPTGRFRPLANKEQQNYLKEQRAALERMLVESKIAQSVRRIEVNEEVKKRTKPKTTDWDD